MKWEKVVAFERVHVGRYECQIEEDVVYNWKVVVAGGNGLFCGTGSTKTREAARRCCEVIVDAFIQVDTLTTEDGAEVTP